MNVEIWGNVEGIRTLDGKTVESCSQSYISCSRRTWKIVVLRVIANSRTQGYRILVGKALQGTVDMAWPICLERHAS